MIITGKFFQDDDGHTFFVPQDRITKFQDAQMKIWKCKAYSDEWYDAVDEFNNNFGEYRMMYPAEHYIVDLDFADIDG